MIDLLELQIPFKDEYVTRTSRDREHGGGSIDFIQIAKLSGIRLSARDVEFEIKGDLSVQGLAHPFESFTNAFCQSGDENLSGNPFDFSACQS